MEAKQRNPEVNQMLTDLEAEYSTLSKDNPSTIMLSNKMKKFMEILEEKTMTNCRSQIAEVDKYAKMVLVGDKYEIKRTPGKEAEADKALGALQACQANMTNYLESLNMFAQYNMSLLSSSAENCIEDCERKFPVQGHQTELKTCLRHCYDHTYKYVLKASEEMLSIQVDLANEELKKL